MSELRKSRRYTHEQVDRGLLAVAACAGNSAEASRRLGDQGLEIPARTLRAWRCETYPERYVELANAHGHEIEEILVARTREVSLKAAEAELLAIDKTVEELEAGNARDPSASARNLATVRGIGTDKLALLTGRPTHRVEQRTSDDIMDRLRKYGMVVDGTAEEIPPGEEGALDG